MLVVHRATTGAALAQGLADVLADPPADPFTAEVVAVPAAGVERWLAQRLSHVLGAAAGDGVCANVTFPRPGTVLDEALQAALPEHADAVERWTPLRATWPLLTVVDEVCAAGEVWSRTLARHLGAPTSTVDTGRRLAVVARLARLFDDYGQSRPPMLRAWAQGRDERGDGVPLPLDLRWQPELWRRLRAALATASPAELLEDACERLRADPGLSGLPARLSVFGASRLSPARLAVLAALARHRDVHLWLHHASPALWDAAGRAELVRRRAEDATGRALVNPLLTSLSRDVRELQQLLRAHAPGFTDVLHPSPSPRGTLLGRLNLLGRLKQDLAADRVPTSPAALDPGDRSVQVHACHGRTRQVEVLREVVLGLLADDPSLEPRDVLVMCPDVESFAPIVAAAFALGSAQDAAHPAARLRVRLADRALRQTNPLIAVLAQLLELGTARMTASQVLDLAGAPAVRQRFGFADEDVERLRDWTAATGVRWGLDGEHRQAWQLRGLGQGTWRAGLDRLLLGAAVEGAAVEGAAVEDTAVEGGPHLVGGVAPLDDVDSADIDLAGRFAELVDRLDAAQSLMSSRRPAAQWMSGLESAVLSLAEAAPDAPWEQIQLHRELAEVAEAAGASTAPLGLTDVRAVLDPALSGRPTRTGFRTGTLTVCTLVPMRSVPHRVVCLLGLDDGVFPRQSTRDGDDVLARDPWVGERDPRSEDRQLLLDAISAAGEHMVVTYTGADERTGAPVPPAVPLGELLDALDRTAVPPGGRRVRDAVTTRHPLQPFDSRNFTPGALGVPGPFSFDPLGYAGARAAAGERRTPAPFLSGPLPPQPATDVDLADLLRLLEHPARGFLRQRLQVAVPREEEEPADALPVQLDSLQLWAVGERMLAARLAGMAPAECMAVEQLRGGVPPGPLGERCLQEVGHDVERVVQASALERQRPAESHDVDVALTDGTRLTGTVGPVRGQVPLGVTYARLGPRQRLRAWVQLCALTASSPGQWRAVTVGRASGGGRGSSGAVRSELGPLSPADARATLEELVALYRAGLRAPLPLPLKTGAQYAWLRHQGRGENAARTGAQRHWQSDKFPGEQADPEHVLVHGPDAPFDVLTRTTPWPGEGGAGWPTEESDRFGMLARRLWSRLLDAEGTVRP